MRTYLDEFDVVITNKTLVRKNSLLAISNVSSVKILSNKQWWNPFSDKRRYVMVGSNDGTFMKITTKQSDLAIHNVFIDRVFRAVQSAISA